MLFVVCCVLLVDCKYLVVAGCCVLCVLCVLCVVRLGFCVSRGVCFVVCGCVLNCCFVVLLFCCFVVL